MVANILDAVSAYRKATDLPKSGGMVVNAGGGESENFATMLGKLTGESIGNLHQAESISQQAAQGKVSPVDIATAVAHAETSLQMLVTLREKMIAAYQEVTRMSV